LIRLRKILLCNYPFYILLFCSLVSVLIRVNIKYESIYNDEDKYVLGYLEDYYIDGNKLTITLSGKEKIMGSYYFDTEKELISFKELFSLGDYVKLMGIFYKVNSKIVKKNKLNDVIVDGQKEYDVSISRQKAVSNIINDDIKALKRLCQEHQKEMPTQIKLIYDVISNKLNADYSYDMIFSNDKNKTAYDVLEEWYQLEKIEEE